MVSRSRPARGPDAEIRRRERRQPVPKPRKLATSARFFR
jgi:hypothetical protein